MKQILFIAFLSFVLLINIQSQTAQNLANGTIYKEIKFKSTILGYEVKYAVYLPPDYATSDKHYPVLYLLHGYKGNHTSWVKHGGIGKIMDSGIASGEIEPTIVIIPDGKFYWYINDYQSKAPYENFMFSEFLPFIDTTYKTIPNREQRAVAGLSMGGYGSLVWAMQHPDKFSYCVALSAAMFTREALITMPNQLYKFMSLLYGAPGATGNARITKHFIENSPIEIAQNNPADSLRTIKWYIDCGNQDQLRDVNKKLHDIFTERNIDHIYQSRDGRHDWIFWREGITQGLRFMSEGFRKM